MPDQKEKKAEHAKLSRMICMLLNRSLMYQADHPHITESVTNFHQVLAEILPQTNSLSLILNQDQLFLDEEPVDPRINSSRIIALFKKTSIQSVSFLDGITPDEIHAFIDIFTATSKYPNSEIMTEELNTRGVQYLKLNHVFYKKVTKDDEVVSRREADETPIGMAGEGRHSFQKQFMDMLLENVLAEETGQALSMKNLMNDPQGLSQSMLTAENKGMAAVASGNYPAPPGGEGEAGASEAENITPGSTLLYQIQTLSDDVEKKLAEDSDVDMMAVADAVCEMKRQLTVGIESQKALNRAYENETEIVGQVNELADNVIVKLVQNEYRQGAITTARLAQILRRLVPDPEELKRLLPKIKKALLAEGMPVADYLQLVQQLGKELESDGLSRVLHEAAESAGVDGSELLEEIRKQPERAAELMTIAAEIHKGAGDEKAFTQMLVDYVEQLGESMGHPSETASNGDGQAEARKIMSDLGTGLAAQLKGLNFDDDKLARMEERINARIEEVCEKLAAAGDETAGISAGQAGQPSAGEKSKEKTLLQMMEQGLRENDELKQILRIVRSEAAAGNINENDFEQIHDRITSEQAARREAEAKKQLPTGVLKAAEFNAHLEKELFRAKRHELHLSALAFNIVNARADGKIPKDKKIKKAELLNAAFCRLVETTRISDIVGELAPETLAMILPMATKTDGRQALRRINKLLHDQAYEINGVPLKVIIAGSVTTFHPNERPNVDSFVKTMRYELEHVALRIKNIHNLT